MKYVIVHHFQEPSPERGKENHCCCNTLTSIDASVGESCETNRLSWGRGTSVSAGSCKENRRVQKVFPEKEWGRGKLLAINEKDSLPLTKVTDFFL